MKGGGVEFITFLTTDGEKYVNAIYNSFWENMISKIQRLAH